MFEQIKFLFEQKYYMLKNKQIIKIRENVNLADQRAIFKILGEKNKYRIFEMLGRHTKFVIGGIAKTLKISVPSASQQLKILENAETPGKKSLL